MQEEKVVIDSSKKPARQSCAHTGRFVFTLNWLAPAVLLLAGCQIFGIGDGAKSGKVRQMFRLEHGDVDKCGALLSQMGFEKVSQVADANVVTVTGSPAQLNRVALVVC